MARYNPKEIEQKWQEKWRQDKTYEAGMPADPTKKKYILDMFPYPSGSGLHVGHIEGETGTDVISRFYRMQGYSVLHPMGWDSFGLPSENYAIKTGIHPKETTETNVANFKRQMDNVGLSYDWSRELSTANPDYYKWTQWIFLEFFKHGLAYRKEATVNWCSSCQTVLANEQIISLNGKNVCERCESEITHKDLTQWFYKITQYADQLIDDLDTVDWPESTKINQRNWIGKSEGALLVFPIQAQEASIQVFTTRPDTLFGATYVVVAPEHKLIDLLQSQITNWAEVEEYRKAVSNKSDIERLAESKEKTGVQVNGVMAINPATKQPVPVFIADYVLSTYGTGAIMAVPAHDERDYDFAMTMGVDITQVIETPTGVELPYSGDGILTNSGDFSGLQNQEAKSKITEFVEGSVTTTYRLRDWSVSRQRYWGAPIPIVYDPQGVAHSVPFEHLPWILPTDVEFRPTGIAPLAQSKELKERVIKLFGEGWTPETDTIDTFVDSSWYFLRYCDNTNGVEFASKESIEKWMPVDLYVGGAEHTVLHLMYARFLTKALRDLGYINFDEPFLALRHQGDILGPDGKDMSKRRGNVINPDDVVSQVGADTLRMYELFMGPFDATKAWEPGGLKGIYKFIERVWDVTSTVVEANVSETAPKSLRKLHQTIQKVTEDICLLKFNTAIAALMECLNVVKSESQITKSDWGLYVKLLAPLGPFVAEELWQQFYVAPASGFRSIHKGPWPEYKSELAIEETIQIPIQINGKLRATVTVSQSEGLDEGFVLQCAQKDPAVEKYLEGKEISRQIFIPGRMLNILLD